MIQDFNLRGLGDARELGELFVAEAAAAPLVDRGMSNAKLELLCALPRRDLAKGFPSSHACSRSKGQARANFWNSGQIVARSADS